MAIITLSSITYANKAKSYLSLHGLKSRIINTPKDMTKQRGCGYSLVVDNDEERAITLLKQAGYKLLE